MFFRWVWDHVSWLLYYHCPYAIQNKLKIGTVKSKPFFKFFTGPFQISGGPKWFLVGFVPVPHFWIFSEFGVKEAVAQRWSVKKVFFEISQNSQENTCSRVTFFHRPQACNFNKKETLAHALYCEFCEISKSNFFYRTPQVAGSCVIRLLH